MLLRTEHSEIISSLRTLGLDIGANPEDIRSAFRKLAKELHPDVTGQKSDFRFKQITGAYNILKSLSAEELQALCEANPAYEHIKAGRKRQEEARQDQEVQQKARQAQEAQQKARESARESAAKIDAILDKYEHELKDYYTVRSGNQSLDMKAAVLRLNSRNAGAVRALLKHSAHLVNRAEFRKALAGYLRRPEVDNACAEIIASLPFDDTTRKQLAL
ncbi:MAG: DnaJ domain-containing protein, partial [Synergistaceae bacterium]|nr:DnaJ domain-containing protein [Synergistaceae bacterium]